MLENNSKIILHLCAEDGSDTLPYKENGYDVRLITKEIGVENYHPPADVYGIIANPPCTMFSIARTTAKTPRDLKEGMWLVKECLRIIWECQYHFDEKCRKPNLRFWVIENPATGFLKWFLGKPAYEYCPTEFGSRFTKKTALWGDFNHPIKPWWTHPQNTTKLLCGKISTKTKARSECYYDFAKMFYETNP